MLPKFLFNMAVTKNSSEVNSYLCRYGRHQTLACNTIDTEIFQFSSVQVCEPRNIKELNDAATWTMWVYLSMALRYHGANYIGTMEGSSHGQKYVGSALV